MKPRTVVLSALGVLVFLVGSLALRLSALDESPAPRPPLPRFAGPAPVAHAPAPKPIDVASIAVPCWGCPEAEKWPIRFRTDLDLIAPLGDGAANAGVFFKDFAKPLGARRDDVEAAMKRRVDARGDIGKVLPERDPLLLEVEPWVDQAKMRFYPDIFPMDGFNTQIPTDLMLALTLARSWVARADAHPDSPEALEDCRRAVRLGRLLRQEDAVLINDLVGLASIRIGTEELYKLAQRRGDQPLAFACAVVLGEHAPQRLRTAQMVTNFSMRPSIIEGARPRVTLDDAKLHEIISMARSAPDRRFRSETTIQLAAARAVGTSAQRTEAEAALDELARSADPLVAANARWARAVTLTTEDLEKFVPVS